jgi:succinate dehydrogenase / fumarate reductase, cytochrome b subunit
LKPIASFFSSSVGRKWIVGLTGLLLLGFVIVHLLGNLQVFLGPEPINRYGAFLRGLGELLWVMRGGLLVAFVVHIWFTIQLVRENRRATPQKYAVSGYQASTLKSRTMIVSGLILLCFVIFHLLHFTTHDVDKSFATLHDAQGRHDVYRMIILGFRNPAASGFYLVGMFLLCQHLGHGIGSFPQTLGLNGTRTLAFWKKAGPLTAWAIFIGYSAIPVAVLTGFLK